MLVPKVATRNDNVLLLRVLNTLNEAQARWFVAREVLTRERGGLQAMANLTGMSRTTILWKLPASPGTTSSTTSRSPG